MHKMHMHVNILYYCADGLKWVIGNIIDSKKSILLFMLFRCLRGKSLLKIHEEGFGCIVKKGGNNKKMGGG